MKAIYFITTVSLIIFSSWAPKKTDTLKKAEWLIGTWKNETGSVYETWTRKSANELSGKSYMIKEKDTIVFEQIQLIQQSGGLFYIPTVNNQNNGLPVYFQAKKISDSALVFENREHDFPQIIVYSRISADALVAEISGTKNGRNHKQTFPMSRVKQRH